MQNTFTFSAPKMQLSFLIFSCLVTSTIMAPASSVIAKNKSSEVVLQMQTPKMDRLPPPKMLQGSVGQSVMQERPAQPVNALGFSQEGANYPKKVSYVAPDSLAWRAGLQPNDKIIEAHATPVLAGMIVQRGKKQYFCMMDLALLAAKKSAANASPKGTNAENDPAKNLTNYSIVMMVDDSASMGTRDCPDNKTRWQWCREHIHDMYTASHGTLQNNISIVTFDTNFRSYRNCSPAKLADVFENVTPSGETNMAPALEEGFALVRSQLEHGKPAMVSLISDGRPTDVDAVKKSIITETNRLSHPELLQIVFIEVGTPEHYLRELDTELTKQGAAKDIVSVVQFGAVNSQSLTVTLAAEAAKVEERLKSSASLLGSVKRDNEAKKVVDTHVYTPDKAPPAIVHEQIKPKIVLPQPAVKAHPTGTSGGPETVVVKVPEKPVEIDEKEAVLKGAANKHY